MLPTKGYFQDIECPFNTTGCVRPYCHFRHRKKPTESTEEGSNNSSKPGIPTYKPTPKSELAKSHIPISYVPDIAYRSERTVRPLPKIEKITYKPTPLSLLSSASKKSDGEDNNDTIKDIKETIASNVYDPSKSEINFEDLSNEFDLIDEIISDDTKVVEVVSEENKTSDVCETVVSDASDVKIDVESKSSSKDKKEANKSKSSDKKHKEREKNKKSEEKRHKSVEKSEKSAEKSSKHRSSTSSEKSEKSHKSSKEKHSSNTKNKESKHKSTSSKEKTTKSKETHRKQSRKDSSDKRKEKPKETNKKSKEKHTKSSEHHTKQSSKEKHSKKIEKTSKKRSPSPIPINDTFFDDIDLELDEDEDETLRECYKIFNEYKPEPVIPKSSEPSNNEQTNDDIYENISNSKKRLAHANAEYIPTPQSKLPTNKNKSLPTPGQTLTNRYKIAKLAQGTKEQEQIMKEIDEGVRPQGVKRPAPTLLEAARQHKLKKIMTKSSNTGQNLVDDIINGTSKNSTNTTKIVTKKIAAVPNVALLQKAKERISHVKASTQVTVKTIAQTQKQTRIAHIPEFTLSDIPDVLNADKSKLPVNVRTRFLTLIAEECTKLYAMKDEAYQRALNEEYTCYERCKVLTTYRNSAMLAVHKLRKEIQERQAKGLGLLGFGETSESDQKDDFKGKNFYEHIKKWVLTEDELDIHGYPKESNERGVAIIVNKKVVDYGNLDDNFKKCARCSKIYQVDDDGWPLYEEECMYHPLKKRTIRGEQVYLCCKGTDDTGCITSETHVTDGDQNHQLEGFQTTLEPDSPHDSRSFSVYALDCEMCYTTRGLELTRVTIVDTDCKTVYESFVKPLNPIIDYNTRFSGITRDQMERTSTSILQVQANILHLCNARTILVGHSLESDLKALKIVHGTVVDTSVLFPHKMGLPHKRALRALASEYLKKIIQNDVSGHDSAEDAVTCMELLRWKLREELKVRTK